MNRALSLAAGVRRSAAPNPSVGCVILDSAGSAVGEGASAPVGGPHAEAIALGMAGESARNGTTVVTLEPCSHQGRTPPCSDALIRAGVSKVVVALLDPDPRVNGAGIQALEAAGIEVELGVKAEPAAQQLRAYLHHRRTGRPYVVLKLAATLDGRIAAPDGSSRWITGDEARADGHRLRADSDAVLVGAGTVRADDPELTVRVGDGPDPMRIVLGTAPEGARVQPAVELYGTPEAVLRELSGKGILQLLIEGGASVAAQFHRAGLVDRYVLYLAPALLGGEGGTPLMTGPGAETMAEIWRGRFDAVERLGEDLRIEIVSTSPTAPGPTDTGPTDTGPTDTDPSNS